MIAEINNFISIIDSLKRGGVILAPTDTVWGLLCDFENRAAIDKMLRLKGSKSRPIALLCDDWRKLAAFGLMMPGYAGKLAEKFWPGAMTLILKSSASQIRNVAGSDNSIGIRIPDAPLLLRLISEFGKPIAATSANFTGQKAAQKLSAIPDAIKNGVDEIYESPITPSGLASTVIDCTGSAYKIIRQGEISHDEIEKAVS